MAFEKSVFITSYIPFEKEFKDTCPAPLLRKKFSLNAFTNARLNVCALGYGEFYINGKLVTEDKLISPVSDYTKTLWYTSYDVAHLLHAGENVFAAVLGNGWYNEPFKTSWDHDTAPWRDQPKLLMELIIDGETAVYTGEEWRLKPDSAIIYNHLRSGEYFDARKHVKGWNDVSFDDSDWGYARIDPNPPAGVLRKCVCPPIREKEIIPAKRVIRGENGKESGLVQRVDPPKYLGAVIVCQGADKAAVKLAIVEAVSKATGLGADQISVLKMK